MTRISAAALITMLLPVVHGCGSARRGEPIAGPLIIQDDQVALGQRGFMRHCHQCHPGGAAGLGPGINDKPLPGFLIKMQVRSGFGAMPAFSSSDIPDDELDAIAAYLKVLRG